MGLLPSVCNMGRSMPCTTKGAQTMPCASRTAACAYRSPRSNTSLPFPASKKLRDSVPQKNREVKQPPSPPQHWAAPNANVQCTLERNYCLVLDQAASLQNGGEGALPSTLEMACPSNRTLCSPPRDPLAISRSGRPLRILCLSKLRCC